MAWRDSMAIELSGAPRKRFRSSILAHRNNSNENDAVYARDILKISLNTFKKCIGPDESLSLKRRSLVSILNAIRLDPAAYGLKLTLPGPTAPYGGYSQAEYGFIANRYLLYRRSFLTGLNVTRAVLDISWNREKECLSFVEYLRYVSDSGVRQEINYAGDIYMHPDRVLMSLLVIDQGETRLTMLQTPAKSIPGQNVRTIRSHGVLLTHGFPRKYYQPVVSPVVIEQMPSRSQRRLDDLCATLTPGDEGYDTWMRELVQAEQNAAAITPLIARGVKV